MLRTGPGRTVGAHVAVIADLRIHELLPGEQQRRTEPLLSQGRIHRMKKRRLGYPTKRLGVPGFLEERRFYQPPWNGGGRQRGTWLADIVVVVVVYVKKKSTFLIYSHARLPLLSLLTPLG